MLIDREIEFKAINIPPNDAEALESRRISIEYICHFMVTSLPPAKRTELDRAMT